MGEGEERDGDEEEIDSAFALQDAISGTMERDALHQQYDDVWFSRWDGDGRETRLWSLVRTVKSLHPAGTSAEDAFPHVSAVVADWQAAYGIDAERAYYEFTDTWPKVKFDSAKGPLQQAWEKAQAMPLKTPRSQRHATPRYDLFVSLAGWLQYTAGDQKITLPLREVAEVMGSDPRQVSGWRRLAIQDGFLKQVAEHRHVPGGKGLAKGYRFLQIHLIEESARAKRVSQE